MGRKGGGAHCTGDRLLLRVLSRTYDHLIGKPVNMILSTQNPGYSSEVANDSSNLACSPSFQHPCALQFRGVGEGPGAICRKASP